MALAQSWGIREWLMLIFGLLYTAVTIIFTVRGIEVTTTPGWWGIGPGVELAIWKIFAPQAPPSDGGEG